MCAKIRTDPGREFDNEDFKRILISEGYTHEKTATDASSQNGLIERSNRTLKERIRCLLYSARLGTEFWVDALLHSVWLYNHTYHTAIKKTPYECYTNKRSLLDDLLTFGSKIIAKKPGTRSTTVDPFRYEGIFLGYTGTM